MDRKNVLVVGSGNSGMEIALDLANSGARTSIVVRSPVFSALARKTSNVSRDLKIHFTRALWGAMMHVGLVLLEYLPYKWVDSVVTTMSKVVYGIQRPEEGPFVYKAKYGKYPVIDVGTIDKIKSREIQVLRGIRSIKSSNVLSENEKEYKFDVRLQKINQPMAQA